MNFLITSHTNNKPLQHYLCFSYFWQRCWSWYSTSESNNPSAKSLYWIAPITIKNKLNFKIFKYAFAEVVMQLFIYLFINSFIYSPTSTVGVASNLRGCLSQVIVILLMQPPDLQLCVCLLFTPPLRFYLPTSRFSLVLQYHPAGSPMPLHAFSRDDKGKKGHSDRDFRERCPYFAIRRGAAQTHRRTQTILTNTNQRLRKMHVRMEGLVLYFTLHIELNARPRRKEA